MCTTLSYDSYNKFIIPVCQGSAHLLFVSLGPLLRVLSVVGGLGLDPLLTLHLDSGPRLSPVLLMLMQGVGGGAVRPVLLGGNRHRLTSSGWQLPL